MMKYVLVVDDKAENRYLMELLLRVNGYGIMSATNGAEALDMARRSPPDLVVADILMPVMDGYTLCREWKSDAVLSGIPFIFYTATYTEPEDEAFALSLGADRFIVKPQDPVDLEKIIGEALERPSVKTTADSPPTITGEEFHKEHSKTLFRKLEKKQADIETLTRSLFCEMDERRRLEDMLLDFEEKLRNLLDASSEAIVWTDTQGNILFINKRFTHLFGYQPEELNTVDDWLSKAYPDETNRAAMKRTLQNGSDAGIRSGMETVPEESRVLCKDGAFRNVAVANAVISDIRLIIFTDLTGYKNLEAQLFQARKMEEIGRLASGVAHDFNNILTAIIGCGNLILRKLPADGPIRGHVDQILSASNLGAKLVQSILSFSRKQKTEIRPVDPHKLIMGTESFLRRLIGDSIDLRIDLRAEDVVIMADPGQLEQVIMNLVTNARDAIDGGGTITIGAEKALLDRQFISAHGFGAEGPHLLLTVSDTGCGMDEETRSKIFEPFFTTKAKEKGTGLGLSVVHGIVTRHNGHILARSEPGKGTMFSIYFPLFDLRSGTVISPESAA